MASPGASDPTASAPMVGPADPSVAPARPKTVVARPYRSGVGLVVGAAIVAVPALAFKIAGSVADSGDNFFGGPLNSLVASLAYNPLFAASLSMYGVGRARMGERAAWDAHYAGKRKRKARTGLGWGLFGGGIALWGFTRIAWITQPCNGECTLEVLDAGYYGSLPLTYAGLHLGAFGSSYKEHERIYKVVDNWTLSPMSGRGLAGLRLNGQF